MQVQAGVSTPSNSDERPFWASLIMSTIVLGWTLLIAYFLGHEIDLQMRNKAEAIAGRVQTQCLQYMSKRELSLVAVQAFFDASKEITEPEFARYTAHIMATMPGVRSINLVDRDLTLRWISPEATNEKIRNLNLKGLTGEPAARKAWQTGRLSATNPIRLVEGGEGILLFLPIDVRGERIGLVQSVNTIERFREYMSLEDLARFANVKLVDGQGHLVFESGTQSELRVARTLSVADQTWRLEVSPRANWLDFLPVYLVWPIGLTIWAAGLLFIWSDAFASRRLAREVEVRTAELAHSLAELRSLDRMKNDFLNIVTHELRTPLTSIKGYSEFLEDDIGGSLTESQREFVGHIQYNADQLEMLVDDLLDLARLESGKFTLRLQTADAAALARQVVDSFQPQARDIPLTLEAEVPEGPELLEADPHRVTQVLNNLISNALKFTPEGGRVRVVLEPSPEAVTFHVEDTGIGISPENQARVFSKFYQVESDLNRSFKGTGLGLAITRGLVDAHHGQVAVESTLGRGTRMTVKFPRRQPEAEAEA